MLIWQHWDHCLGLICEKLLPPATALVPVETATSLGLSDWYSFLIQTAGTRVFFIHLYQKKWIKPGKKGTSSCTLLIYFQYKAKSSSARSYCYCFCSGLFCSMGTTTNKHCWAKFSSLQASRVLAGTVSSKMSSVPCNMEKTNKQTSNNNTGGKGELDENNS